MTVVFDDSTKVRGKPPVKNEDYERTIELWKKVLYDLVQATTSCCVRGEL